MAQWIKGLPIKHEDLHQGTRQLWRDWVILAYEQLEKTMKIKGRD